MASPTLPEKLRRVLLVDPDEAFGNVLQEVLGDGYQISQTTGPQGLLPLDGQFDVILVSIDASTNADQTHSYRNLLRTALDQPSTPPIIAFGWCKHSSAALELFQDGAVDFLEQPLDIQELRFAMNRACRRAAMARELHAAQKLLTSKCVGGLLGNSKAMARVADTIHKVAGVFTSVLITGESGTGKGVVANAIHQLSPRAKKPFVAFSVCSFPDSLIDDELFGHERGAFTGASQSRRGRFEEANGGTIFIDEIGDLALPLQAKLLRVLQERTVERLGSNVPHPVDVRVICATNRNLEQMVRNGTFREDLYFRISVVQIQMPALRDRAEDVPLLAEYFLGVFARAHKKQQRRMTPGFLAALAQHSWPGNVRELQNIMERSVVLANGHEHLGVDDLPTELQGLNICDELTKRSFHESVRGFKRELVRSALSKHQGNKLRAARELGISRCYLHRLLNQLNIGVGSEETETEVAEETREADVMDMGVQTQRTSNQESLGAGRVCRSAFRIA